MVGAERDNPKTTVRNPRRTRARILRSATVLFAAKGLNGTTVDEIAARAGVNKRMLYHYFGNKEGLYLSVLKSVYERIGQIGTEIIAKVSNLRELLDGLLREYFGFLQQNPEFISLLNWENSSGAEGLRKIDLKGLAQPFMTAVRQALDHEQTTLSIREDVDVKYLMMACLGLCSYYFTNRHTLSVVFDLELDLPAHMEQWINHVSQLILDGIAARGPGVTGAS
ncbi:MAG: TetR family transcriptional regulator [Actinobacteria bacterium]|nr:TetR family transcriptional regulator [Actinomycetota bacterium]